MIRLDILSLVPTSYAQCPHCETLYAQSGIGASVHQEIIQEYPPELMRDHFRLSDWIRELSEQYGSHIEIHVIDPQSLLGFLKCARHRVRGYPTFIVNHKSKYTGWDKKVLEALLQAALAE